MSKNTLLSELINYVSANANGNVVVSSPTSGIALDVNGDGRYTGQLTLGSTITNGTFTYTLPSITGTIALTSNLSSYVPTSRTITINGTTFDLSADRSYTISTGTTLNGTGFVKASGTTISYDNSTYLTSITSSNVTTALGYTPVTNARTLTINGTAYDLSADRSWTVSGGISGSGTTNRLLKFTGSTAAGDSTLSESSNVVSFNGATFNRLNYGSTGVAAPTFTSYSNGVKIVLYDSITSSDAGFTIGIEGATMFHTVNQTSSGFKWYGGTTQAATLSGTGTFTCIALTETSSIRYKENVVTLDNALEKVLNMRGVSYNRKENTNKEIGVIAEEVNEIVPEFIKYNDNKQPDSVLYGRMSALFIEAFKEQQKQIEELKSLLGK